MSALLAGAAVGRQHRSPPEAYAQGGYEAGVTFFAPEAEGIVRQTAVEVLESVSA
jgi:hypothetical protein